EDAEMASAFMERVDDGLAMGDDIRVLCVEVGDPSERLLRRRDVVSVRAEADDRRANVPQIDAHAVPGHNLAACELVADEQLVDDEPYLVGIQIDVTAPPPLEAEIPSCFR